MAQSSSVSHQIQSGVQHSEFPFVGTIKMVVVNSLIENLVKASLVPIDANQNKLCQSLISHDAGIFNEHDFIPVHSSEIPVNLLFKIVFENLI